MSCLARWARSSSGLIAGTWPRCGCATTKAGHSFRSGPRTYWDPMPPAPTTKRVWLADELRNELLSLGAQAYPNEVGGILVGYRNGGDVVVTTLVGPGPAATSSRSSFTPDGAFHTAEMARIYSDSQGSVDYLGD